MPTTVMELYNELLVALVVGGVAIIGAVKIYVTWRVGFEQRKHEQELKQKDEDHKQDIADREARRTGEQALQTQEVLEQTAHLQLLTQQGKNQEQLIIQIAAMLSQNERQIGVMTGIRTGLDDTGKTMSSLANDVSIMATKGSVPVQRIDTNVAAVVEQIEIVKDIAIATADLTNASQEAILNAFMEAVKDIKAVIQKRKTDSQPIVHIPDNGENKPKTEEINR